MEFYEEDIPDYDLWTKLIESAIRIWPDILSDYFHIALYHIDLGKPYHLLSFHVPVDFRHNSPRDNIKH